MKSIHPLKFWSSSTLLLLLSTSVGVFLPGFSGGQGAIAVAQSVSPPDNTPSAETGNNADASGFPLPQLPDTAPNERLNPSGNPLMFPTKPDEVDTTVRQAITLDEAIDLALRNNEQLQQAKLSLEQQEAGLMAARAAFSLAWTRILPLVGIVVRRPKPPMPSLPTRIKPLPSTQNCVRKLAPMQWVTST
ncbi:hypothetical protein NON20_14900 [Synechocystis sp. B12]|nr:hypothetical protein NON20_14900 [Synechocystis sp. B12]